MTQEEKEDLQSIVVRVIRWLGRSSGSSVTSNAIARYAALPEKFVEPVFKFLEDKKVLKYTGAWHGKTWYDCNKKAITEMLLRLKK
jgi:hypothetical protein